MSVEDATMIIIYDDNNDIVLTIPIPIPIPIMTGVRVVRWTDGQPCTWRPTQKLAKVGRNGEIVTAKRVWTKQAPLHPCSPDLENVSCPSNKPQPRRIK